MDVRQAQRHQALVELVCDDLRKESISRVSIVIAMQEDYTVP